MGSWTRRDEEHAGLVTCSCNCEDMGCMHSRAEKHELV
jgi:hypothetical protein